MYRGEHSVVLGQCFQIIYICPCMWTLCARGLNKMEYNTLQHQDQTNSEALCTQESTYMNDTTYHLCSDLKKKLKKKRLTYRPSNFQAKRANKRFIFFYRPYAKKGEKKERKLLPSSEILNKWWGLSFQCFKERKIENKIAKGDTILFFVALFKVARACDPNINVLLLKFRWLSIVWKTFVIIDSFW